MLIPANIKPEMPFPVIARIRLGDIVALDHGEYGIDFYSLVDGKRLMFLNDAAVDALLMHSLTRRTVAYMDKRQAETGRAPSPTV